MEIDESKFGKRKYNVGRVIEGQWVFGAICRGTRDFFMVPVGNRSAGTLLKIIKDRVKPGSTIISDCWRAYDCLESEGYQHLKVNHSLNFVDPCLHGSRCQTLPSVIFIKGKWLLFLSCNLF